MIPGTMPPESLFRSSPLRRRIDLSSSVGRNPFDGFRVSAHDFDTEVGVRSPQSTTPSADSVGPTSCATRSTLSQIRYDDDMVGSAVMTCQWWDGSTCQTSSWPVSLPLQWDDQNSCPPLEGRIPSPMCDLSASAPWCTELATGCHLVWSRVGECLCKCPSDDAPWPRGHRPDHGIDMTLTRESPGLLGLIDASASGCVLNCIESELRSLAHNAVLAALQALPSMCEFFDDVTEMIEAVFAGATLLELGPFASLTPAGKELYREIIHEQIMKLRSDLMKQAAGVDGWDCKLIEHAIAKQIRQLEAQIDADARSIEYYCGGACIVCGF